MTPTSAERATYEAAIARNVATAATLPVSADDEPIYAFLEQILTDHPEVFEVFLGFDATYAGRPLFLSVARGASGLLRTDNSDYSFDLGDLNYMDGKTGFWGYYLHSAGELGDIRTVEYAARVVKAGVTVGILYTNYGPLAPKP